MIGSTDECRINTPTFARTHTEQEKGSRKTKNEEKECEITGWNNSER